MWGSRPGNAVRLAITGPVQWGVVTNIPQGPVAIDVRLRFLHFGRRGLPCAVGFSIG